MSIFPVYPLQNCTPVRGLGCYIWSEEGEKYLDFYGGHAVISIGHSHPKYVKKVTEQLSSLGFYSNSVHVPLQEKFAKKLGQLSGLPEYSLFLVNSGAEANENALKLASFSNKRTTILACKKSFHGRTSGAVAVTDNSSLKAPLNFDSHVHFMDLNDVHALEKNINSETCAVIIEDIQGVGGIRVAEEDFLRKTQELCKKFGAFFIIDAVQSGYGRTGKFFAFQQYKDLQPDIISMAKGMGNGFPIGGILIAPHIKAEMGMLGTTFGGNHLACAAGLAVVEVLESENLIENARKMGDYLHIELKKIPQIKSIRGKGLMIGLDVESPVSQIRDQLLYKNRIFCGTSGQNTLRLLPPLCITKEDCDLFLEGLRRVFS